MLREGRVSLKGNPAELQDQGVFTNVLAELESSEDKEDKEDDVDGNGIDNEQPKLSADILDEEDPSKSVNDETPEDKYNLRRLKNIAEQRGLDSNGDLSALQGTLVEDEERESGYVKSEVWLTYLNACGNKWFWATLLALTIVSQLALVLQDYWIRIWVAVTGSSASGDIYAVFPAYASVEQKHHSAVYWIGIYMLLGIMTVFWSMVHTRYFLGGSIRAAHNLHSRLLRQVVRATPRFFDSTPLGRIVSRFSYDMRTAGFAMDPIVSFTSDILAVLNVVIIVSLVTPMFVIVAVVVSLLYVSIAYYYLNTSRELKRLESTSMSPLLSLFGELILGVSTIRAFGAKHFYIKEALNRINAHNQPSYLVWATNSWLSIRMDSAGVLVSFTCALFILANLDWLDAGLAGFALAYSMTFSDHMLGAIRNYSANEQNMNAIERISQYLKIEQEAELLTTPVNRPPTGWPRTGNVQIEDLVIEYVPGVPVLHGISLTAEHGEKIGVVGRTGAGKSTMSLAFLRFIEAAQGRILLDNVDISKIGLEELRRNVTIIPQDPVLFNGTIRFNLDPFGEYPDELVWDALKRAHLVRERGSQTTSTATSVYDGGDNTNEAGVERMSGIFTGLDAEIKENGQNLSLGQRQLVALARALVRRSRLIIMDEATASVDFDTDDRIQRTIHGAEFANSTLFCIAHRLRTIIDYDRVLMLDKGKVAEFDTPWNLLQREGGIFRSMCEKSGEYEHLFATAQRKSQLATTSASIQ
ncbi:hypothetical protein GGI13_003854 [Coemansia sp. RSA 455]|nr:hypothetical protein GGI13_003854 [Coemansia sp. RSA 455]